MYLICDSKTLAQKLLSKIASYDELKRKHYSKLSAAERRHLELIERTAKAMTVRR